MNSTSSFVYDLQATHSLEGTQSRELFALDPVTKFSLPHHTILARNPRNGREARSIVDAEFPFNPTP